MLILLQKTEHRRRVASILEVLFPGITAMIETEYASSEVTFQESEASEESKARRVAQGAPNPGARMVVPRAWRRKKVSCSIAPDQLYNSLVLLVRQTSSVARRAIQSWQGYQRE